VGLAILKPIPNYLESYPTKLFEYMGLGLPFITSSFPLYKSIVNNTHAGITVSPLNPNDIANNMFELAQNPEK
jgi:glycosyltransferase involved in cell wall biosynthesis